jgi:exosortase H (IPTLxxWG-CTERM-specific)
MLRFLALFVTYLGAFYAIVLIPSVDRAFYAYLEANAWLANVILHALGQSTSVNEVTIRAADFAVSIRRGCDALEPSWFFCAAILAYPSPWRRKGWPLLAGVAALLALNLVRIVSLFFIGRYWPRFFAPAHLELWPAAFILLALVLWLGWIRSVARNDPSPSHAKA